MALILLARRFAEGAVAGLVGIEYGVVSGGINLESSGVEGSDWRPRHDEHYHEACFFAACGRYGRRSEWKSQTLRAYQRRTLAADALIASIYLAGTNTRRVRRALAALKAIRRSKPGGRRTVASTNAKNCSKRRSNSP